MESGPSSARANRGPAGDALPIGANPRDMGELIAASRALAAGQAPGLDGAHLELWKTLLGVAGKREIPGEQPRGRRCFAGRGAAVPQRSAGQYLSFQLAVIL
eukprot:1040673-Pyramimonas_sp.AAC.1